MNKKNFQLFTIFLKNIFSKLFEPCIANLIVIFNNPIRIPIFFICIFFIFILIQIQILIGFFFFCYYIFFFLLLYFLGIPYTLSCYEFPFNFRYLIRHTIFNLIVSLPRAKAFIYFYNLSSFIFGKKFSKLRFDINFFLNIILILIFFILFYYFTSKFLWIFGFSYLSLFISSYFVNQFFYFYNLEYKTKKAKTQHIIINCFINFDYSVGYANNLLILLKYDGVNFLIVHNIWDKIKKLTEPFNRIDLFKKAVNVKQHYSYKYRVKGSMMYTSRSVQQDPHSYYKNLTVSAVKTPEIDVTVDCKTKTTFKLSKLFRGPVVMGVKPNLDDVRYLTPVHEVNPNSIVIDEIPDESVEHLNSFGYRSSLEILLNRDSPMIYRNGDEYHLFKDSPTVSDYAVENNILIADQINLLKQFEAENKDYLQTTEGKQNYELLKSAFKLPESYLHND